MTKRNFHHKSETFGFDKDSAWSMNALRLLFSVPRAYQPLVTAWNVKYPGTIKALEKLKEMGFISYQQSVLVDTRTGLLADKLSSPVSRYKLNNKGKALFNSATTDIRVLHDEFPRLTMQNATKVLKLLEQFNLDVSNGKFGQSIPAALSTLDLPERSGRWWVSHFIEKGFMVELAEKVADVREIIPAHYRVNRVLCTQLKDVIEAFPDTAPPTLAIEFRLSRTRFLDDIDPSRIGVSGATDFDHDVQCQNLLSAIIKSPKCALAGIFAVEPRILLRTSLGSTPWKFSENGTNQVFYQPDAEIREKDGIGIPSRSVIEYERFQSRRDAWSHIERFLGWLHLKSLPMEPAVLRFVVDSDSRARSYVELIEAFADWALDNQSHIPANNITLAVSTLDRIIKAEDPLDSKNWFRVSIKGSKDIKISPVLHDTNKSPYDSYFSYTEDEL